MSAQTMASRWLCPNDRELTMRSRLPGGGRGWSTRSVLQGGSPTISAEEFSRIQRALNMADQFDRVEHIRVRTMLVKLDRLRRGSTIHVSAHHCQLCGTDFTILTKHKLKRCQPCRRTVCSSCGFEALVDGYTQWVCHYCSEQQQVWKKSGVWFYGNISKTFSDAFNQSDVIASFTVSRSRAPESRRSGTPMELDISSLEHLQNIAERAQSFGESESKRASRIAMETAEDEDDDSELCEDEDARQLTLARSVAKQHAATRRPHDNGTFDSRTKVSALAIDSGSGGASSRTRSHAFSAFPRSPATLPRNRPKGMVVPGDPDTTDEDEQDECDGLKSTKKQSPQPQSKRRQKEKISPVHQPTFKRHSSRGPPVQVSDSEEDESGEDVDIDKLVQEVSVKKSMPRKGNTLGLSTPDNLGSIYFNVAFDAADCRLTIVVDKCTDLKAMDPNGFSDPFVVVQLLPCSSKATEKRTNVIKKNCNPVFKETFSYHGISERELSNYTLRLQVYDHDRVTQDDFIGECVLALSEVQANTFAAFHKDLAPHQELALDKQSEGPALGKLQMSLHYISSQQCLVVGILRAAGLKAMDPNGFSDPYVKCYLHPDPRKSSKQKTKVMQRTLDPVFNTEFRYPINRQDLTHKTLEISVWDYDRTSRNDFIGVIYLSKSASGPELKHFYDAITMVDRTHTVWHALSPNKRTFSDF